MGELVWSSTFKTTTVDIKPTVEIPSAKKITAYLGKGNTHYNNFLRTFKKNRLIAAMRPDIRSVTLNASSTARRWQNGRWQECHFVPARSTNQKEAFSLIAFSFISLELPFYKKKEIGFPAILCGIAETFVCYYPIDGTKKQCTLAPSLERWSQIVF